MDGRETSSPDDTPADEEDLARWQLRKEAKVLAEAGRPLNPWERYRALIDALEESVELSEIADRKVRFAMVLMTALNLGFFVLATRPEIADLLHPRLRPFLGLYLLAYAVVAVFFFVEAIEALRPRNGRRVARAHAASARSRGLRDYEDVVSRDVEAYGRAWRDVRFGELNAELAEQNHAFARVNQEKYAALCRLYAGLRVLTVLAGGLVGAAGASMVLSPRTATDGGELGAPTRLARIGVREPSGVAWHASLQRLFLVGDEGRLVEIDPRRGAVATWRVPGNLEDVAVHPASGELFLLSEKEARLIAWDPSTHEERQRFAIDRAGVLGVAPASANQGFEGLAFREEAGGASPLFLAHQRRPALVVAVEFDPMASTGIGAESVRSRWSLAPHEDLTALAWVPQLQRLLVLVDGEDLVLVLSPWGRIERSLALPRGRHEGLCLDDEGGLWVADDRGGLFRFEHALPRLSARPDLEPRVGELLRP